jgi:hypothetical protein
MKESEDFRITLQFKDFLICVHKEIKADDKNKQEVQLEIQKVRKGQIQQPRRQPTLRVHISTPSLMNMRRHL